MSLPTVLHLGPRASQGTEIRATDAHSMKQRGTDAALVLKTTHWTENKGHFLLGMQVTAAV